MRDSQLSIACLAAYLLLLNGLFTSVATANDVEDATATLKACVDQAIPGERKKAKPRVERLLLACESELDAVLQHVPDSFRDDIKHEIRHQADDKLRKDKKAD